MEASTDMRCDLSVKFLPNWERERPVVNVSADPPASKRYTRMVRSFIPGKIELLRIKGLPLIRRDEKNEAGLLVRREILPR